VSAPLGKEQSGRSGRGGARPTEHQLQRARIRAGVTGESLSHVLSVFMGVGRYGEAAGAPATGPEAPLPHGPPGPADPADRAGPDEADGTAELARVIPLSRGARVRDASGALPDEV
jgi:hypothetical protein